MSDMDLTRYERDNYGMCPSLGGDYVRLDDVAPIIEEVKRLRAENTALRAISSDDVEELAALRAQVPVWNTVTEDPATLPDRECRILVECQRPKMSHHDTGERERVVYAAGFFFEKGPLGHELRMPGLAWCLLPGDRWTYVPEAPNETQPDQEVK